MTDEMVRFPWEGGVCPAHFRDSFSWVGIAFTNEVPVLPCQKDPADPCLGKRYNFDATPHSRKPYCGHAAGRAQCEQVRACINPEGPDLWMFNANWIGAHPCDKHTTNRYKCHHVPRRHETGPTTVCALPAGAPQPSSPDVVPGLNGRCVTKDVHP